MFDRKSEDSGNDVMFRFVPPGEAGASGLRCSNQLPEVCAPRRDAPASPPARTVGGTCRVAAGLRALRSSRFLAAALLLGVTSARAAAPDLLSRTDVFAAAPASFVSRLEVTDPTGKRAPVSLEVYRSGDDLALLRLLDPKEKGKFFLRRGRDLYFLAPGSARPLKLDPGHRLAGAVSFDEILGLRLTRDYRVERTDEPQLGGAVTFHLVTTSPAAPFPKVRWVVDPKRVAPLRADLAFADGRAARVVEFVTWRDEKKLQPRKLRVIDVVRGGVAAEIDFQSFEARSLSASLFALDDAGERAKLP